MRTNYEHAAVVGLVVIDLADLQSTSRRLLDTTARARTCVGCDQQISQAAKKPSSTTLAHFSKNRTDSLSADRFDPRTAEMSVLWFAVPPIGCLFFHHAFELE
ncbi:uncharacterized protein C8A04DRAFT_25338 [Dichotomopilus funicola]|uniref:Uncharacterized protein n=1 Tax=Dichotomopilus funicola TaxID=1934379 RepID=A0AAN6V8K8_9PEZI|nr:hypothetical protein C8A04DRAFT_25338 [Dichotomopilus funicola]